VSIRLPDDVEARLAREADRLERPQSELARDAIVEYLQRIERERFLGELARAARAR
jgi:predicted transcriptional regulator